MNQPPPKKTNSPAVWPLVIHDVRHGNTADLPPEHRRSLVERMSKRRDFGAAKYGVSLQVENGRDALEDCMDEALDGCAYSRQQAARSLDPYDWETHRQFVALAARLQARMSSRGKADNDDAHTPKAASMGGMRCTRCGAEWEQDFGARSSHLCPPFEPQT